MRHCVEVLASNPHVCVLNGLHGTGVMSSRFLSCYPLKFRSKTSKRPRTDSNAADLHVNN